MRSAGSAFAVVCLTLAACGPDTLQEAPPDLQGRWHTEQASHADVGFEIGPRVLTIDAGENGTRSHPVDRLEVEEEGGVRRYSLYYTNRDAASDVFRIRYSEDPAPLIRLEHQDKVLWRKSGTTH